MRKMRSFANVAIPSLILSLLIATPHVAWADEPWPTWMQALGKFIEPPNVIPAVRRKSCEQRILAALSTHYEVNFTESDIAEIRAPGWPEPQPGFVRGGAYNLRITASGLSQAQLDRIDTGRFIGRFDGIPDELKPSLHVPDQIKGVPVFSKQFVNGKGSVDFVAHIDTAYAYLPIGLLVHFIRDVLGRHSRNPCP